MTAGLLPDGWTEWPDSSKQQLLEAMTGKVVAMRSARWRPYPWQVPPRALQAQEMFLCLGGRGVGKALRYDTPMPTPRHQLSRTRTGWTTMGDLRPGDELYDEQGLPCAVTAVHEIPAGRAYRVRFSDGTYLDASADHLWTTLTHADRKAISRRGQRIGVTWAQERSPITTDEMRATLTYGKRDDLNHCIPLAYALQAPAQQLPVDPWLLGYWLGNGSLHKGRITTHADDEAWVRVRAGRRTTYATFGDAAPTFNVPGLIGDLRAIGVVDSKHVPAQYLRASEQQRRDLLAGLLDSDGHQAPNGNVEFSSKDYPLAAGVLELARSLKVKATLNEGVSHLNGKPMGPRYRVTWRAAETCPFQSPRKAQAWPGVSAAQGARNQHRMVVAVDPIDPEPMRCIAVDSPSRLFLAGAGMIPTHNTDGASRYVVEHIAGPPCDPRLKGGHRIAIVAPTLGDAVESCVDGPSGLRAHDHRVQLIGGLGGSHVRFPGGAQGKLFGAFTPEDVERLRSGGNRSLPVGTPIRTATGTRPIEDVQVGEMVWTEAGLRPVLRNMDHGTRPLVHVRHSAGVLTCTPDHEVWVCGTGWVQAQNLRPGGNLTVWNARATPGSESASTGAGPDCGSQTDADPPSSCTVGSTSDTTARYRQARTSTTSTGTATTTILATLRRVRQRSTSPSTAPSEVPTGTLPAAEQLATRRAPSSLASTAQARSGRAQGNGSAASSAGEHTPARTPAPCGHAPCAAVLGSLATSASPSLVHAVVKTVSLGPVDAPVRDLTVAGQHTFIAADVLVSNCLVWIEELAAMRRLAGVLEHTRLGLRIGSSPHYVASTTPKPRKELRQLIADPRTLLTHGRTSQAYHLDAKVRAVYDEMYAGTRLGRQELEGEMLDDVEGALWAWWMFDVDGFRVDPADVDSLELDRVVVSVDPATTSGEHSDSSGLVVAGRGRPPGHDRTADTRPRGYVLHSQSVRMTPEKTMQLAARLFYLHEADCIVIEANNGGDYLPAVLRQVDPTVPVRLIHASRGKHTRAEPVAALYEQGRVSHVGTAAAFLSLEDQLTSWTGESGQDSPDEMDALCHAMHDLLVAQAPAAAGRVRDRRFAGRR